MDHSFQLHKVKPVCLKNISCRQPFIFTLAENAVVCQALMQSPPRSKSFPRMPEGTIWVMDYLTGGLWAADEKALVYPVEPRDPIVFVPVTPREE